MSATPASRRQGRLLTLWAPEDKSFWEREGEAIAKLNLWISVPALFLAFAIWQVWSVVAVSLPGLGFKYSTNPLFWLAAAPALSGATLRIFYSFMVPLVGGRRWTAISTASLLIPAIGIGFAVQDNTTTYPTMLILALLCGLRGKGGLGIGNVVHAEPGGQRRQRNPWHPDECGVLRPHLHGLAVLDDGLAFATKDAEDACRDDQRAQKLHHRNAQVTQACIHAQR